MIKSRYFETEEDFLLMQNLIRENYVNCDLRLYPSATDLEYWRYIYDDSPDNVKNARLWLDDNGQMLAFAWMNEDAVDYVCHYQHQYLLGEIIDWSEQERRSNSDGEIVNCLYVFDCDEMGQTITENKGYQKSEVFNYYGKKSLLGKIPKAKPPIGYIIKSIKTDEEIKMRAQMNNLAGNEITPDKYRYFMQHATSYRQELDLIAVDSSGEIAGFCTVWFDSITKTGSIEPYAVHPGHLRKGIGKSLLCEGLHRLLYLDCTEAYVTHAGLDSDETDPALALNEAVGFKKVGSNFLWFKKL